MAQHAYDQAPDTSTARELRTGGRILVTTLLCPKQSTKADLKALYRRRWHIELDLRHMKTALGMATLSYMTATMAVEELWPESQNPICAPPSTFRC